MVKTQLDLNEAEDKTVKMYKLLYNLKTKEEAIKKMILTFENDIVLKQKEENKNETNWTRKNC